MSTLKEQEKRIKLLEKEVALHKEILEFEEKLRAIRTVDPPYRIDYWPYYEPYEHWNDGTGDCPLPPQNVTIC